MPRSGARSGMPCLRCVPRRFQRPYDMRVQRRRTWGIVLAAKLRSWLVRPLSDEKPASADASAELLERTLREFDLQQPITTAEEAATVVRGDPNDALGCCVLGYAALAHAD